MWTYTADSLGYMLYKDGKPVRGARSMGSYSRTRDGRVRHWKHQIADAKMHKETAERECARLNAENGE